MFRILALMFLGLALAAPSQAQPPAAAVASPSTRLLPFSGTALDASGAPLKGTATVTFELYEEQNGNGSLWQETQRVQTDGQGRYLAYLGSVNPLPQFAFGEERARWLGVTIQGRAEPRVMLAAVPYALRAADADTLGGQPAADFVRARADGRLETSAGVITEAAVDGSGVPGQLAKFSGATTLSSSVISESASNRIGVGLPDPTGGGVVDSVFTIKNLDNNTGFAVLNESQARRFALNTLATGAWTLYDGGNSTWNQGLTQINGNVGIGITAPTNKLRVIDSSQTAIFASALSSGSHGVRGEAPSGSIAILGVVSNSPTDVFSNAGVLGYNTTGGAGVSGISTSSGAGVSGFSTTGDAVVGNTSSGTAGHFFGNVVVTGTLSKGGGSFKIDHPLDPTNKYLMHSFVESPDMMNVYNGNVTLDDNGEAWVTLPEWFESLNRDFRYQLTAVGAPGPTLYIAAKVSGNRFKISGGTAAGEVSWQVTGIRRDAWANAHRIVVEEDKPGNERGTYLHPDAFPATTATGMPSNGATRAAQKPVEKKR